MKKNIYLIGLNDHITPSGFGKVKWMVLITIMPALRAYGIKK